MALEIAGKSFVIWFVILIMAIVNGTFREGILIPALGKTPGLILSGVLLSALIFAVSYVTLPWIGRLTPEKYVAIGLGWLFLTLLFEFSFGRLVQGKSWLDIFEAYTFKDGNIWPVVLFITAVAPYIAAKVRGLA